MRANTTLYRSRHALYALLALVAVLACLGFELPRPWHAGGSHGAMRVTGWAALGAMLLVLGYVLRKYMHKLGYSPEFRHKLTLADLEAFDDRLNALRLEVLAGRVRGADAIRARLPEVLAGVQRVVKVELEPGEDPGAPPRLVARPTEPFGRTARWLHAHLYFGLLFGAFVWLHARGGAHAPLGLLLQGSAGVLTVTGLLGITLWAFGPTWLSRKERRHRLSIEQAFVFRRHYRFKIKACMAALAPAERQALAEVWRTRSAPGLAARSRRALEGPTLAAPEARARAQEVLVLIGQYQRVRAALRDLWRARLLFMAWRYAHVPCAALMLGLALLHLVSVWKY